MEIQLTAEQDSFIHKAVEEGRFQNSAEAINRAMDMFVERERRRMELLADLESAEISYAQGRYTEYTEATLKNLPQIIAERGRARQAARNAHSSH